MTGVSNLCQTLQFGQTETNVRQRNRSMSYKHGQICACTNKIGRKKRSWYVEEKGRMLSRIQVIAGEVKSGMGGR